MISCKVVAVWVQDEVFILLALWFSATDYLHLSLPPPTPLILAYPSPHRLCRQGGSSTPATVTVGRHHRPLRTEHFWLRASPRTSQTCYFASRHPSLINPRIFPCRENFDCSFTAELLVRRRLLHTFTHMNLRAISTRWYSQTCLARSRQAQSTTDNLNISAHLHPSLTRAFHNVVAISSPGAIRIHRVVDHTHLRKHSH